MSALGGLWHRVGLVALAVVMALVYLMVGARADDGAPLMPVDDAYIHFQYAKQAALGQPYVYNPGEGATSGATSLIYPWILSAGWLVGFRGLWLGVWAISVGIAGLAACGIFTRRIVRAGGGGFWLAEMVGAALVVCGALVWHAVSGMETLLASALTLALFDGFTGQNQRQLLITAALLTITRPEGGILAALACGLALLREWRAGGFSPRLSVYALPVALMGVQPLINLALTGSASASGGQAKSLLSLVPADWSYIIGRVLENFGRMWAELLTGLGAGGIAYVPPLLGVLALTGLALMARRRPWSVALVILWALALTGAVSTLDTAFWHFKRYQMPLLVLLFPLTGWLLARLPVRAGYVGAAVLIVASLLAGAPFQEYYRLNTESVAAQPYRMAEWLRENAPGARVAVHDVGMMRYHGEVLTLDMVGLTTPGAADAWLSGPGTVGEWLMGLPTPPDLYAAYDLARGLNYLVAALEGVPPGVLAEFVHPFDPVTNVALGGERQVIIGMGGLTAGDPVPQHALLAAVLAARYQLTDSVDVADLVSESAHWYVWDGMPSPGFPTEFYRHTTLGCDSCAPEPDGGRRISGGESFTLTGTPGAAHVLVTRVHPSAGVTELQVRVNGSVLAGRLVPAQPGAWFEFWTPIPARLAPDGVLTVEMEVLAGIYMPYQHWLYAQTAPGESVSVGEPVVSFDSAGVLLEAVETTREDARLTVRLAWRASDAGRLELPTDAVAFAHLYADLGQPPVAQVDVRPGRGALPPSNWAEPVSGFTDEFVLDLTSLTPGTYTLAVGLYEPTTFARFAPRVAGGAYEERDGRVLVTEIIVK